MKLTPDQIKPNPDNPRFIRDDKFQKLVNSVKQFPEMAEVREVVVNKDYMILGGNMRFKAMIEAGWSEIPVRVVDWSVEKQREFVIKDNISGGDWDWDLLANEWDSQQLDAWGVELPSYSGVNDAEDNFDQFDDMANEDKYYHLNISFRTEAEYQSFLEKNEIELDNNFKRVGKVVSIFYPLEEKRDVKNLRFE